MGAVALALLSPASAAPKPRSANPTAASFTPAATDARLAAAMARAGLTNNGFRFTPASSIRLNRSVTVAVRARTTRVATAAAPANERAALVAPTALALAPVAYNLGVAVGWRKFALSGTVADVDIAGLGRREALDLGISYNLKRFTTRLAVGADRASTAGSAPRGLVGGNGVSVDLGGAYALSRNVDVTAGVRYRAERDRLLPGGDERRDSQAVYVGTAFRF